tara:strand:+ start:136 stop:669 length:534 start_codon:yes stop_codon:yes gene_type:complete
MKFVKLPIDVLMDSRLSANDMRVLVWLIYRSTPNRNNECWPSIRKLSEDTGINKKKIPFYTKRLVNFGWIEKKTEGKGGVKNPQKYHVLTTTESGGVKQSPNRGSKSPKDGTETVPESEGVTPYKEKRKGNYKKKGEDKKNILNFSSRELSDANEEKSRRLLNRLLKMEEQQKYANV